MASLTRVHPAATPTLPVTMGGSTETLVIVEVDYGADVSAKTGAESTMAKVHQMCRTFGTVTYLGPLFDSDTRQHIGIEGCTTDTAVANFASMAVMAAALQALGTVDSIDLSSMTVIKGGPSAALQDAIV